MKSWNKWLCILPAFIVMIIIFIFSAQHAKESSAGSDYIVQQIVTVIDHVSDTLGIEYDKNSVNLDLMTFIVRKLAHTAEYALLGFCISFYLNQWLLGGKVKLVISLAWGFLYACTDEFHQYFVPGRSCEFRDVLIDTNGVFLGSMLFFGMMILIRRMQKKHSDE